MHYVGIDLHKRTLVIAVEDDEGPVGRAHSFPCHDPPVVRRHMEQLRPLQEAFRRHHGLQCGFCTPGMLATAFEFLRDNPTPTREEARLALSGVLCRCTGYRQIIDAVLDAAESSRR